MSVAWRYHSPLPSRSSDGMGLYSKLTEYQPGLLSLVTFFAYAEGHFSFFNISFNISYIAAVVAVAFLATTVIVPVMYV